MLCLRFQCFFLFFFNDTATTEIYTLSLHDALPISVRSTSMGAATRPTAATATRASCTSSTGAGRGDRKSTRLNSSHLVISYAVFCLKKKKKTVKEDERNLERVPVKVSQQFYN